MASRCCLLVRTANVFDALDSSTTLGHRVGDPELLVHGAETHGSSASEERGRDDAHEVDCRASAAGGNVRNFGSPESVRGSVCGAAGPSVNLGQMASANAESKGPTSRLGDRRRCFYCGLASGRGDTWTSGVGGAAMPAPM